MKNRLMLKHTIFLATVLVAVTILLVFWFICRQRFSISMTEQVVQDYQETTAAIQENVETLVTYGNDFAKYLSMDSVLQTTLANYQAGQPYSAQEALLLEQEWQHVSVKLLYSTTMVAGIGIYSGDELLYSFYNSSVALNTDILPPEALHAAVKTQKPLWTGLLSLKNTSLYRNAPDPVFAILKSVQADDGSPLGTVVLYIRETSFAQTLLAAEQLNKRFYLVDEQNRIIVSSDESLLYQNAQSALDLTDEQYAKVSGHGSLLMHDKHQSDTLYMSVQLGSLGWRLIGQTRLETLAIQQKTLQLFMQMILLLSVVLAIIAAWLVSKRVTRPLGRLIAVMKNIETDKGQTHPRAPTDAGGEMGILSEEFNHLMDQLDAYAEQIYQEQRQRRHNEVRLLQAQVVPHFLYNTMGTISSFIKIGMADEALTTIQNLVNFYRLSLSGGKEIISIADEMELTKNYLTLQQLRYVEFMRYEIAYDERLAGIRIPKLTIQPLVENVLHHGLRRDGKLCMIHLEVVSAPAGGMKITVADNGCGMTPERLAQIRESLQNGQSVTNSFGILNVYQRLRLLYGEQFQMEISSEEGCGTSFCLSLPLRQDETIE